MSARDDVLARIRTALAGQPPAADVPRTYRQHGEHSPGSAALLELLTDRLVDYKAAVVPCGPGEEAPAVAAVLAERRLIRVVAPQRVPDAWLGSAEVVRDDPPLTVEALDATDAVVTGCAVAVAGTGTIVLDGGPDQGRRALTLVPDVHVVVVRADQVVQTVPEALARLDPVRPLTMISGPSATSDIELDRVEGVHGPRTLVVVLVRG